MAEILGAVASGLAVAEVGLKAGGTVWKLKKLWQEVHDVPTTIQDLMRQIEIMDPILSDHETALGNQSIALLTQIPSHSGAPATQSAAYCRDALNDLQGLVEDLDVAIKSGKRGRRAVARMRVMLKKDIIKGFEDRLERAIRLLQWTQVTYLALVPIIILLDVTFSVLMSIQSQCHNHEGHDDRNVDRCGRHSGAATAHVTAAGQQQPDRKTAFSSCCSTRWDVSGADPGQTKESPSSRKRNRSPLV